MPEMKQWSYYSIFMVKAVGLVVEKENGTNRVVMALTWVKKTTALTLVKVGHFNHRFHQGKIMVSQTVFPQMKMYLSSSTVQCLFVLGLAASVDVLSKSSVAELGCSNKYEFLFLPLSMTLTICQGHIGMKQLKLKIGFLFHTHSVHVQSALF